MGCINFILGLFDVSWVDAAQAVIALFTKVAPGMVGDSAGICALVCGGLPVICGGIVLAIPLLLGAGLLVVAMPYVGACLLPSVFGISGVSTACCGAIPGLTEMITPMMGAVTAAGAAAPGP